MEYYVRNLGNLSTKQKKVKLIGSLLCRGNHCPKSEIWLDFGAIQLTDRSPTLTQRA